MAKAPAQQQTTTEEPKAPVWVLDDTFDLDVAPPVVAGTSSSRELPFKALFGTMLPHALEGKKPSKPFPLTFFKERSTEPAGMDLSKAQGKVRGQFNTWLKTLPQHQADVLALSVVQKSGKENDAKLKEEHLVFWLLTSKPYVKPAEPAPEAPKEEEGTEQQEAPGEQAPEAGAEAPTEG